MRCRTYAFAFLALLPLLACGARTSLPVGGGPDGAGQAPDAGLSCAADPGGPTVPCAAWTIAGADRIVAPTTGASGTIGVSTPVASGCGALLAWYTATGPEATYVQWFTRAIDWDGTPRTDVTSHPDLAVTTPFSNPMGLAVNGSAVAGLVSDSTGCRFAPLDLAGLDRGPVVALGSAGCSALGAEGDGFSFLTSADQGATPVTLHRVDAKGGAATATPLSIPSGRALWDRLVLADGSFLVSTFREDPSGQYTDWVQRFDPVGAALAPENALPNVNTAPVLLAPTSTGVLGAWLWSTVGVVPLTANGVENGLPQSVAVSAPLYGVLPVPVGGGDVLLLWWQDGTGRYDLFAQATAPSGTPRGPVVSLKTRSAAGRFYGVASPGGNRALLVFVDEEGLKATPLSCAR